MNSMLKRFGFLVLGLAVIFAWSLQVNAAGYTMIDLGVLPGGTYSRATAINNAGQIAGYGDSATSGGLPHAFVYSGGVMTDLGTLPNTPSGTQAWAINNAGQVVGQTWPWSPKVFLWSGGVMTQVSGPPALYDSMGYGINDSGQIVGYGTWINGTGDDNGFLYSGGVVTDLKNGGYGPAYGINNAGQVVGLADFGTGAHAFLYAGGVMKDLGTLGGLNNNWGSCANAINNAGLIVGSTTINPNGGPQHAFLYANGVMQDLGVINNQNESCAKAINSAGQIVGWYGAGIYGRAFIWSNGVMEDLGDLDPTNNDDVYHTWAYGINDAGWIVGDSMTATGADHAFLAMPGSEVPLPSTLLLLASGLLGLLALRQRRAAHA